VHLNVAIDPVNPSWTVLIKKHPKRRPAHPTAHQPIPSVPDSHPVIFEALNGSVIICSAAL